MHLDLNFESHAHFRYENGFHAPGPPDRAIRVIKVEPNINRGEGYTVTIFNMDGGNASVQMAPKQMRIIKEMVGKVVLRGFGSDDFGGQFADYGLTIYFDNDVPNKCVLHIFDRNIDIEYLAEDNEDQNEDSDILSVAKNAISQYQYSNVTNGRQLLISIYQSVRSNPGLLKTVKDLGPIGTSFLLMIDEKLTDDIDTLQMMASVSYLCISKAIDKDPKNLNLFRDRSLLLHLGREPLAYTVKAALGLHTNIMDIVDNFHLAIDAIYKMQIVDLEFHPELYLNMPLFKEIYNEFNEMIKKQYFFPEIDFDDIIKSGIENHAKLLGYLEEVIFAQEDVDF